MKYILLIILCVVASCKNKEEMTGKTKKGDLMSPCVGTNGSPCSNRFNPNASHPELHKYIS